jgi:hypothetical protein
LHASKLQLETAASVRAADWFLHSGIQTTVGGVSRYFRGDQSRFLPISTEITGYAIPGLLLLGQAGAAARAGRFLADRAWDPVLRLFPFELSDGDPCRAFFFDCGIIARGLLVLWKATGEERFLQLAIGAGDAMIRDFRAADGYHPIIGLPSKRPHAHRDWWSQRPGCFQLKAALAWRQLAEITGETRFEENYQRQLEFSLRCWPELLAIETEPLRVMDRLHAYCYFLEGLLPGQADHRELIRNGINEICDARSRLSGQFERSDVWAQLLRVRLISGIGLEHAAAEAEHLAGFQMESGDARLNGSFSFGRRDGVLLPHANPVSTVFAVQALDWWHSYRNGKLTATWHDLN